MATVTIHPNADGGGGGGWENEVGGTSNFYQKLNDWSDSTWIRTNNSSSTRFFSFDDMPGDFDEITSALVRVRLRRTAKSGDYLYWLNCRLWQSDESTALSSAHTITDSTTATTFEYSMSLTGATNKTAWDGVKVAVTTGTGSTGYCMLYDVEIDLVYEASAGSTFNESGSGGAVSGGSAVVLKGSLNSGLAAFWKLEESSGTRYDSTLNHNDLSASGSPGSTTGRVGDGATFVSASNQSLTIADNSSINLAGSDWSVSLWVKFSALTNNAGNDYLGVMSKGSGSTPYAFSIQYRPSVSQLQVQFFNSPTTYTLFASTFGAMTTGTWYHIVVTYTNSSKATTISVNGTQNSGTSTIAVVDSAYGLSIGRAYHLNTYNSSATIDAVGLWKRVLTTNEKAKLYRMGHGNEFSFENNFSETCSGGATGGGKAVKSEADIISSGGIAAGGHAALSFSAFPTVSGGAILGGSVEVLEFEPEWGYQVSTSGLVISSQGETTLLNQMVSALTTRENLSLHLFVDVIDEEDVPTIELEDFDECSHPEYAPESVTGWGAPATEGDGAIITADSVYFGSWGDFDDPATSIYGWYLKGDTSDIVYAVHVFESIAIINNVNQLEVRPKIFFKGAV